MNQRRHPGRPPTDGEKAELNLRLCLTPSRKKAYREAAGEIPVHLWAKRLLDCAAKYTAK